MKKKEAKWEQRQATTQGISQVLESDTLDETPKTSEPRGIPVSCLASTESIITSMNREKEIYYASKNEPWDESRDNETDDEKPKQTSIESLLN